MSYFLGARFRDQFLRFLTRLLKCCDLGIPETRVWLGLSYRRGAAGDDRFTFIGTETYLGRLAASMAAWRKELSSRYFCSHLATSPSSLMILPSRSRNFLFNSAAVSAPEPDPLPPTSPEPAGQVKLKHTHGKHCDFMSHTTNETSIEHKISFGIHYDFRNASQIPSFQKK